MGIDSGYGVGSLKTGVCTSTTRPAVPFEGQTIYETDTDLTKVYNGTAFVNVSALVRVGGGTLSGSSTAFTNVFSATYQAYKIIVSGGTLSTTSYVKMILGATTTGYLSAQPGSNFSTGAFSTGLQNSGTGFFVGYAAGEFGSDITIVSPQLARYTHTSSSLGFVDGNVGASHNGVLENTTQYTGFTLSATGGTFTGTVNIYGYALS
jgi:hypothetical protein